MDSYDPHVSPPSTEWLETDEGDHIELVLAYHRRRQINLPDSHLHAVVHVVVENQVALGEDVVVRTLARLQAEGLDRHDAVHAIGSVLAEDLYTLMQTGEAATGAYQRYLERLQRLRAKTWRAG